MMEFNYFCYFKKEERLGDTLLRISFAVLSLRMDHDIYSNRCLLGHLSPGLVDTAVCCSSSARVFFSLMGLALTGRLQGNRHELDAYERKIHPHLERDLQLLSLHE
jgi:hypothetical protein